MNKADIEHLRLSGCNGCDVCRDIANRAEAEQKLDFAVRPAGLLELCEQVLELAEHGDYSNGNEACGVDEGRVRSGEALDLYRKELERYQEQSKIKIAYRGWPGHFCASRYCIFRLNTLVEVGEVRVVVSTVGNMQPPPTHREDAQVEEVGCGRYYETMAFRAALKKSGYWDQDSGHDIPLRGEWSVGVLDIHSDDAAQRMHEDAIQEMVQRILSGEIK